MSGWLFTGGAPQFYEDELFDPRSVPVGAVAYHLGGTWNMPEPGWLTVRFPDTTERKPVFFPRVRAWYLLPDDQVPKHLKAWLLILETP